MTKLPSTSPNPLQQRLEVLQTQFPEIFADGKLSLPKLQELLGENVDTSRERFGLTWAGRADAVRALQNGTTATLRPEREQSLEFDTTGNLILEGDNLEVLKLLQHAYHRQVKLIYIDPPYNTGNDFVYPDDFRDGARAYRRFSGQVDEDGNATTTDQGSGGRMHSRWLSMMYPRLQLAKSLLRDDGVIFISIDDNELANLRLVMDEIFGPENFLATVVWQKKYATANDTTDFSYTHEYLVSYSKTRILNSSGKAVETLQRMGRTEEQNKLYKNPDNDPHGLWMSDNYTCNKSAEQRPNLYYAIEQPSTGEEIWPDRSAVWRYSKEKHIQNEREGRVWWGANGNNTTPRYKRYLSEVGDVVSNTWWEYEDVGHTDEAKKEFKALFPADGDAFDTPKPVRLMKRLLELGTTPEGDEETGEGHLVMDFFAGSGTVGQAVMEKNVEDSGNRRFILVQLDQATKNTNYPTITSVTRARVRKVGESKRAAVNGSLGMEGALDLGFRAFRWDTSNFKQYDPHAEDQMEMLRALQQNVLEGRSAEDQLFEILLRAGLPLSSRYEVVQVNGQDVYSVQSGKLLICLARPIHEGTLRAMLTHSPRPEQVVCLDVAFESENPDAVKMNIVSEMRDHGIQFRTV
ncbi:site-specific DNA-methyltransferase [Deinococcus aestuarii]|uniref:site-specific DNA-methyltransferase n=1 Tax=Deinococcus aestuarii TaxID=2774531 RepID=UPI001C0B8812|nr:site-specific DNA-methyltransferase [Deinococcus aestuarii]